MKEGAWEKVMGVSLIINIIGISLLLLASFPMALLIVMFLVSLGTDELFTLEDPMLYALQVLFLFLAMTVLMTCLIVTVGSRVYVESQVQREREGKSRSDPNILVWALIIALITPVLLIVLGAAGRLDPGEAIALFIIFMVGSMFMSIGYGLAALHLCHYRVEAWSVRMKGFTRLPPALFLLGFPAVSMLAVLDGFPFTSVLLVFCWSVLLISLAVILVANSRTLYALRGSGGGSGEGDGGHRMPAGKGGSMRSRPSL